MKKIALLLVLILVLCSAGCGANTTDFKTPDKISAYQYADFDKFNSPAEENGLGGTQIYVDGKFETIFEIEDCFYGRLKSGNNKWCVFFSTSSETKLSQLSFLEGQNVRIFGVYQGFAENLDMPMLSCIKITLSDTGECYNNLEFYSSVSTIFETELATAIESGEELNSAKSNEEINKTEFFDLSAYDFIKKFTTISGITMNESFKTDGGKDTNYAFVDFVSNPNLSFNILEDVNTKKIQTLSIIFMKNVVQESFMSALKVIDKSIHTDNDALKIYDSLIASQKANNSDFGFTDSSEISYMIHNSNTGTIWITLTKQS